MDFSRSAVRRSQPVIRDVCRPCNNGPLSGLDAYGINLYQRHFKAEVRAPFRIRFSYEHAKLLKWLIKLCYNEARITGQLAPEHRQFAHWVVGLDPQPPLAIDLFLGIIEAAASTARQRELGAGEFLYPWVFRIGRVTSALSPGRLALGRVVSFNSFFFVVLTWLPGVPRASRREVVRGMRLLKRMKELPPSARDVTLERPCMDSQEYLVMTRLEVAEHPVKPLAP